MVGTVGTAAVVAVGTLVGAVFSAVGTSVVAVCSVAGAVAAAVGTSVVTVGAVAAVVGTSEVVVAAVFSAVGTVARARAMAAAVGKLLTVRTAVAAIFEPGKLTVVRIGPTVVPDVGKLVSQQDAFTVTLVTVRRATPLLIRISSGPTGYNTQAAEALSSPSCSEPASPTCRASHLVQGTH